jgi:predicted RNase H-like HicB family nuclease
MEGMALIAVYLKARHGYVGFVEELPGVNAHGATLDETRAALRGMMSVVFEEERRAVEEQLAGREVVREILRIPSGLEARARSGERTA